MGVKVLVGDARAALRTLPDESVDCCVTSPPYFGLRDYGVEGQIGREPTLREFVDALVDVFREVRRVLKPHGTGYLNIDDARVPLNGDAVPEFERNWRRRPMPGFGDTVEWTSRQVGKRGVSKDEAAWRKVRNNTAHNAIFDINNGPQGPADHHAGRWPANVVHDGSAEVMAEFPHTASGKGDEHGLMYPKAEGTGPSFNLPPIEQQRLIGDAGSAARFFYTAKPCRGEKEAGLHGHPRDLKPAIKRKVEADLTLTDATCGYTGGGTTPRANVHPTCKPIALMRWLVRLACTRGGVVLDPFAGSGTTAIAALLECRRWIAIEREPEYARIAQARIEWWAREAARKPGGRWRRSWGRRRARSGRMSPTLGRGACCEGVWGTAAAPAAARARGHRGRRGRV